MLLRVHVEHKADQRPLQTRTGAHVHRKPRSAQLGRALQVKNPQRLANLPVRLWLKVETLLLAPQLHNLVVFLVAPGRHLVARQVGNPRQREPHLVVQRGGGLVQLVQFVLEGPCLVHHGGGFVVLARLLQRAHLLRELVAPRLQLFGLGNGIAAALVQQIEVAQKRGRIGPARA